MRAVIALAFALAALAGAARADGCNRIVEIVNDTDREVLRLYADSDRPEAEPEGDVLDRQTLPAGKVLTFNMDLNGVQCRFNVKVVFADGEERKRDHFDACETRELRISTLEIVR